MYNTATTPVLWNWRRVLPLVTEGFGSSTSTRAGFGLKRTTTIKYSGQLIGWVREHNAFTGDNHKNINDLIQQNFKFFPIASEFGVVNLFYNHSKTTGLGNINCLFGECTNM